MPPSCARSRPRPRRTPSSACRSSSPELREDSGEIEAALAGRLPELIDLADLRGDLHTHSDWSDGHYPIEVMAEHARRRGYAYQVLTDHTQSLAIAGGLTPDRVAEQAEIIAALNARYAAEEAAGTAPPETPPEGFRLLHGCELEIRADGALDFEDDLLARFDVVVASVHVVAPPVARRADPPDAQRRSAARTSTSSPTRPGARSASATTSTSTGTRSTPRRRGPGPRSR